MAKSARQTVFEGMELLPESLTPFVEKRFEASLKGHWQSRVVERVHNVRTDGSGIILWDQAALFAAMDIYWMEAFRSVLGKSDRALVNELREVRNTLSHNGTFSYDDAERALDSMRRLLMAISAGEAAEQIGRKRDSILRLKFAELARNEERRKTRQTSELSVETTKGLKPWREVVEPHTDVASGDFKQAEFAADLGTVYKGEAPAEYGDPVEFFGRTYLTDGLSELLVSAARRFSQTAGDPVIELQTNFGGGKTHSMLALYHMVGQTPANALPGLDQLLNQHQLKVPKDVKRAVFVGTHIGPSDLEHTEHGLRLHTIWGRMAWQLGGAKGFALVAEADARGVSPGAEVLIKLFRSCGSCLILIDEWVAFLRQIYKVDGLSAGSFDANLSFAQALTEAVKASPGTLLVASLPASQIEVGGEGGEEALSRLKQTFSRVECSWRPATQEESYEIVRRRLFKEVSADNFQHRDNTLKQFAALYRDFAKDFPPSCTEADYRRKLEKAFPIHPELFDQLYETWGSVERFQRTRGVLRLMAQVIHELWMSNDPSVMIMPGSVTIKSERVEPELLKYLEANWASIIATDVDGGDSTPYKVDKERPNLNRYSATRRIARSVFMATAPTGQMQNQGLDDRRINLGVVQPGEKTAIFSDALRRLSNEAKYLHSDQGRYWYSTKPSLNRLAADRAAQQEEASVRAAIDQSIKEALNKQSQRGHFDAVHAIPSDSGEIPDELSGLRLIVLGIDYTHNGKATSSARKESQHILHRRGSAPRVYRNTLIFLAPDQRMLEHLLKSMRDLMGWREIVRDEKRLDLTHSDSELAKAKLSEADAAFQAKLQETWCHLLYPEQDTPQEEVFWSGCKISNQENLILSSSKKLEQDDVIVPELAPSNFSLKLKKSIWNTNTPHLKLNDIWQYCGQYIYLPRLVSKQVLSGAVKAAVQGMAPGVFSYAESFDEQKQYYSGLLIMNVFDANIIISDQSVILRPEVAEAQLQQDEQASIVSSEASESVATVTLPSPDSSVPEAPKAESKPTHFYGEVAISEDRPSRDMGAIVEGIIEQLTTLQDARVEIKLEITADVPSGFERGQVRTLIENANTLKFSKKDIS